MASLHDFKGNCDLCSLEADSEVAEVVGLDCSFAQCPEEASLYHQACLEKYLKSIRCERNRKIGFPCPRGCGKNTRFSEKCKGKVTKSHPVTIRSEGNKKRRQAELDSLRTVVPEQTKSKKDKEKEKQAAPLDRKAAAKAAKSAHPVKALNVANASFTKVLPPKSAAELKKESLAQQRDKLRAEISAHKSGNLAAAKLAAAKQQPLAPASKEVKTLEEWEAERNGGSAKLERFGSTASSSSQQWMGSGGASAPTASNAWGRPRAASGQTPSPVLLSPAPSLSHPAPICAPSASTAAGRGLPHGGGYSALSSGWADEESLADMEGGGGMVSGGSSQPATPPSSFAIGGGAATAMDPNQPIPGMVLASPEVKSAAKLTKAQRKNLKRAEKKAAARHEEGTAGDDTGSALSGAGSHSHTAPSVDVAGSHASDAELYAFAGGEGAGGFLGGSGLSSGATPAAAEQEVYGVGGHAANVSLESEMDVTGQCMRCVVQRKLQLQVAELQALGFPGSAAARAVVMTGGDLEAAVTLLLAPDGGEAALAGAQHSEAVDISEELSAVQAIRMQYNFPAGVVEAVVIDHDGDIDAAEASLQQSAAEEEEAATAQAQHHVQQQRHAQQLADSGAMSSLFHGTAFDHHLQAHHQQAHLQQYPSTSGSAAAAAASHADNNGWPASLMMGGGADANGGGAGGWNSLLGLEGVTQAALSAVHGGDGLSPLTMPPSSSSQHAQHAQQHASFLPHDRQAGGSASLFGDALGLLGITSTAPEPPPEQQHAGGNSLWGGSGLGALGGFSSESGPGSPLAAAYDPIHVHPQHAQHSQPPSQHNSSSFFASSGPQSPLYAAHHNGNGGGGVNSSNAHSAHSSAPGGGSWFDAPAQHHHHQQQMPSAAAAWAPLGGVSGGSASSPMRGSMDRGGFFGAPGGLHHPLGGVRVAGAAGNGAAVVPPHQQQQQQQHPSVEDTELSELMATLMCR